MERRMTNYDISWFLDQNRTKQLDLDPPYQRRSVWTLKDKQFFLDTILKNYPSPPVYLHKSIDEQGVSVYHVVDGKQRIKTILDFADNLISLSRSFGDARLNGKKWKDIQDEKQIKETFWNYAINVELLSSIDPAIVTEVFDRINRNSRKLTRQELRHARFDGWLITTSEAEAEKQEWKTFGIVTTARAKRMSDVQFMSELIALLLERKITGFDQDSIDELYAKYEDPAEAVPTFSQDEYESAIETVKQFMNDVERETNAITPYAKNLANFYSLWAYLVLARPPELSAREFGTKYTIFMKRVEDLAETENLEEFLRTHDAEEYKLPLTYLNNLRGASTDLSPRLERHKALVCFFGGEI